jgi:hypothetical protein
MVDMGADPEAIQSAGFFFLNIGPPTAPNVRLRRHTEWGDVIHTPSYKILVPDRELVSGQEVAYMNHRLRTLSALVLQERSTAPLAQKLYRVHALGSIANWAEHRAAESVANRYPDWQPISIAGAR